MLKYFAAFVLLVVLSVFVTSQHEKHAHDTASPPEQPSNAVLASHDAKQTNRNSEDAKWYSPSGNLAYMVFGFPNGITVWALFLTMTVIAEQTRQTRKAAEATQTSAGAALQTVRVMIDSERPWIIAHMEQSNGLCLLDNGNVRFTWTVKNVGKSPAKLIESGAMVSLDTLGPPIDPIQYKMEALNERILVPGDSLPLFVFWSVVESGRIRTRLGKTLDEFNDLAIVYGRIRYRSAISTTDVYETRFSESGTISGGACDGFEPHWPVNPEDIRCT